jgi:hypothetical protein
MSSGFRGLISAGSLLLVGLVGCGKSSPTEPAIDFGCPATVFKATLTNTSGAATLIQYQFVLDGKLIDVPDQPAPVASVNIARAFTPAFIGHHVLAVLIAKQTATPSGYTVLAPQVYLEFAEGFVCSGHGKTVVLSDKTATLATGESISYTFDL